jgi:CheY-like chemotaxis protein
VAVESAGEGQGATFTVELPILAGARDPVRGPEAPAITRTTLGGLRVLVVDDDPDSNDAVRNVLAAAGAVVRTAASTGEALAVLARWVPDVLVSDLAMPNEDGYALLARMRSDEARLGRIPAIALTALSAADDRAHALSAGFHAHVAKPPRTDELLHAVVAARHSLAS